MAERAQTKTEVESVAEAYLELLAARGIDYFFGNGGTDFAPIVEAYAKRFNKEQVNGNLRRLGSPGSATLQLLHRDLGTELRMLPAREAQDDRSRLLHRMFILARSGSDRVIDLQ